MLSRTTDLGLEENEGQLAKDTRMGWIALGLYLLLSWVWAFSVDAPWDDDCPTRFFNTQDAFREPENLVSDWNRPLFVWIFALPSQLGKGVVPIGMALISALGAWLLWRGLRKAQVPNAWLAIPLMAFQPFFYGTSRAALTEPLAAVLLCAGFFFLVRRQWLPYALMGGLLPLARLELTPLLLIWLWPLLRERQWKAIALLALPFIFWNVLAGFITGDFNYVYSQTVGLDAGKNRYGNTGFFHYFRRSMWVTGPVVFALWAMGTLSRLVRRKPGLWLEGQLAIGFMIYVVFSWKLSLGNAAGFLRNLVPLTPLVALGALEGFNRLSALVSASGPFHAAKDRRLGWAGLLATLAGVVAVCIAFFSLRLNLHQVPVPIPDYSPIAALLLWCGLVGLVAYAASQGTAPAALRQRLGIGTLVVVAGYTLYTEPPAASANEDRQAMGIVADYYSQSEFAGRPTYANHNWFFWRIGEHPDGKDFDRVTMQNLDAAPQGAIVVWDVHYCTRLGGDVLPTYFYERSEFVPLLQVGFSNRGEAVLLLEKCAKDFKAQEARSAGFYQQNQDFLPALTARGFHLLWTQRFSEGLQLFDRALGSVRNDPDLWFGHGYALLRLGRFQEASVSLRNAVTLFPRFPTAWFNLGRAYGGYGDYKNSLSAFNRAISLNEKTAEVYFSRGAVLAKMGDLESAIADFDEALRLDPRHYQSLLNRAAALALAKQFEEALADLQAADAIKPDDPERIFVQGRVLQQMGRLDEGCAMLRLAVAKGLQQAAEFVEKTCGADQAK